VIRENGTRLTLNPKEIVVGDVLAIKGGDQCFADCCLFECDEKAGVSMDEAALTGESELLKKLPNKDPFLLSSTVCASHGNAEDAKALVIGVGAFSQWGRIQANLEQEDVNTPLQDKLEDMVVIIGYLGTAAAFLTFTVTMIYIAVSDPSAQDWLTGAIQAFIIAITIIVVAIPEGLPLAVTISLAYSMKKMALDNNLVKQLQACETMGNATNICSDKTGTLTEGRMALVEGWFADSFVREEGFNDFFGKFKDGPVPQGKEAWQGKAGGEWLAPMLQNIGMNSSGEVTYGFTYFAPPKDKEPVCLPWLADEELLKAKIPEEWGEDRLNESRYQQVMKDRPDHFNMTELALLSFAHKLDFNTVDAKKNGDVQRVVPFNSKVKRSAAIIGIGNGNVRVLVKGAPEIIVGYCSHFATSKGGSEALNKAKLDELSNAQDAMSNGQKRVICLAHKDVPKSSLPAEPAVLTEEQLDALVVSGLTVDAFVGIIDPLRPDVPESVRIAQAAGVKVRMVTGDNLKTATAIADKAGIFKTGDIAMEGPEFRKLTPAQLDDMLPRLTVLARSAPEDKFLMVTRLNGKNMPKDQKEWEAAHPGANWDQEKDLLLPGYLAEWNKSHPGGGDVVGVTGDGTNDAPALKAADVGLAMNSGTSVAKEASDIVVLDDNFSSIVTAIKWGRCVYDNIRKFLQFQLTVNVVALLLVFIAALMGNADSPLNAVQMLWVNLIMDTMGALALGTEQPTDELLLRPPYKREASLVSRPMGRNILAQSAFQLIVLLMLLSLGADWFNVPEGNVCGKYDKKAFDDNEGMHWSLKGNYVGKNKGSVGCSTFLDGTGPADLDCSNDLSYECYEDKGYDKFDKDDKTHLTFEETCLQCEEWDFRHYTIIFNAFVFCQIFNEFNARSIGDDWRVFTGLHKNPIFMGVIIVTIALQIFIVEVGGLFTKTSSLSVMQWVVSAAIGFIALPLGVLMRLIPAKEDPSNFASVPEISSGTSKV
jgi:magnesium-transporting ATPase (P-type)